MTLGLSSGTGVWHAAGVADMRAGFNSLAAKVQSVRDARIERLQMSSTRRRWSWPRARLRSSI